MRTRRLVLTLLAVGLISSVCWVSVWAWATAWRDIPTMKVTVGGSYGAFMTNTYTIRVTGQKLVCVDIDSNTLYGCDTWPLVPGVCPNVGTPFGGLIEYLTNDAARWACDPQVTVRLASTGAVVTGSDNTFGWPVPAFGAPAPQPTFPQAVPFGEQMDYDPFVCWFTPVSPSTNLYLIQVQDSVGNTIPQGCSHYLMTVTSNPASNGGTLLPIGGTNF